MRLCGPTRGRDRPAAEQAGSAHVTCDPASRQKDRFTPRQAFRFGTESQTLAGSATMRQRKSGDRDRVRERR